MSPRPRTATSPGFYLLWVVDSSGRPCQQAAIVRIASLGCDLVLDRSTFGVHEVSPERWLLRGRTERRLRGVRWLPSERARVSADAADGGAALRRRRHARPHGPAAKRSGYTSTSGMVVTRPPGSTTRLSDSPPIAANGLPVTRTVEPDLACERWPGRNNRGRHHGRSNAAVAYRPTRRW